MTAADFLPAGLDLWQFAILCAVSFLASLITATLSLGGGMLMLAVLALFIPPAALIPLHGAVQLGSNAGRAVLMRRDVLRPVLPTFIFGSIIGALIGGQLVVTLPTDLLQAILGAFILYSVWAPGFRARKPGRRAFFILALASSLATMFVGATGPLILPFIAAASTSRQQIAATHAVLMTVQHLLKLIAFALLGFSFAAWLPLLAGLLAFGLAGTWTGRHVLNRLPERAFRLILKTVLTLIALRLLSALWPSAF